MGTAKFPYRSNIIRTNTRAAEEVFAIPNHASKVKAVAKCPLFLTDDATAPVGVQKELESDSKTKPPKLLFPKWEMKEDRTFCEEKSTSLPACHKIDGGRWERHWSDGERRFSGLSDEKSDRKQHTYSIF